MKGDISISRSSDGRIHVSITDKKSRIQFVRFSMTCEAFGEAVTGLACRDIDFDTHGLEYIGKTRVSERRNVQCQLNTYDKDELKRWLLENCQEPGWLLDTYLGSQGSVQYDGDKRILHYGVTKYVDSPSEQEGGSS